MPTLLLIVVSGVANAFAVYPKLMGANNLGPQGLPLEVSVIVGIATKDERDVLCVARLKCAHAKHRRSRRQKIYLK